MRIRFSTTAARHWPAALLRRCMPSVAQHVRGFTLIEMLVVVAIMALLMSILTPSLSRARQQAKATVCLTRLSEFMKGITSYSHDNQFLLPPMQYDLKKEPNSPRHGWAEALYTYMYQDKDFATNEDFPVLRNRENRYQLWQDKEAVPLADSTGHYRVYEYTWRLGSLDQIKPKLPLIIDANPRVKDPNDLRRADIPMEHIAGLEDEAYIEERHYGGANYSFNDGHAERRTELKELLAADWDLDPATENR